MFNNPDLMDGLAQLAVAIMSLVVTVLSIYLGPKVAMFTGQAVEEKHAKMLHEAAMSWADKAVREGVTEATNAAMEDFLVYAKKSIPDAINYLTPGPGVIKTILNRYITKTLDRVQ